MENETAIVTELELQISEFYSPTGLTEDCIIRVFCKNELKSLKHPFNCPVTFEFSVYEPTTEIVVSLEEEGRELAFTEINLASVLPDGYGSLRQWFQLAHKGTSSELPSESYRMHMSLTVRELSAPHEEKSKLEGIPGCLRCSYLEKLSSSQQNELRCLQESKLNQKAIRQILKEHYDTESSRPVESSQEEVGHLREATEELNQKLQGLQGVQSEVKTARELLFDSQIKRVRLENSVQDTTEQLEQEYKQCSGKHSGLVQQRAALMQRLLKLKQHSSEKTLENDGLRSSVATLEAKQGELRISEFNYNSMKEHIDSLNRETEKSSAKKAELRKQHEQSLRDFTAAKDAQRKNVDRLHREEQNLVTELDSLNSRLSDQDSTNSEIARTNICLDQEIVQLQQSLQQLQGENEENAGNKELALQREASCIALHTELHAAARQFEQELQEMTEINQKLMEAKKSVTSGLNKAEDVLEQRTKQVQELNRAHFLAMNSTTVLEQHLIIHQDREHIKETLDSQCRVNSQIKDILLHELTIMTEHLEKQSGECLALSQSVLQCKRRLESCEEEKAQVNLLVDSLKKTITRYVPVKGDALDEGLAEFLNARDDWATVGFTRHSEGNYSLGSKEIQVFEEDGELAVQLGNGVLELEDFLNTYVPLEQNKLQVSTRNTLRQQLVSAYLDSK